MGLIFSDLYTKIEPAIKIAAVSRFFTKTQFLFYVSADFNQLSATPLQGAHFTMACGLSDTLFTTTGKKAYI